MSAFTQAWALLKDEKFMQDASSWDFMDEDGVPYYDSAMSPEWSHGLCSDMACAVNSSWERTQRNWMHSIEKPMRPILSVRLAIT